MDQKDKIKTSKLLLDAINLAINRPGLLETVNFNTKYITEYFVKYYDLATNKEVDINNLINGSFIKNQNWKFLPNTNLSNNFTGIDLLEASIKFRTGLIVEIKLSQVSNNTTEQINKVELYKSSGILFFKDKMKLQETVSRKNHYYKVTYENLTIDLSREIAEELIGKLKHSWFNHLQQINLQQLETYLKPYQK